MSALYWGVEEKEQKLRDAVSSSLSNTPGLRVKILLDWCRGTRLVGGQSSVTLLSPLLSSLPQHSTTERSSRCRLAFHQTPQLRGWLSRLLPSKWNELLGLQHCKVYIFDNSLVISGANLSRDYFTNRQVRNANDHDNVGIIYYIYLYLQDRYVVIEDCKPLADYYEGLVDRISEFSLQLQSNGEFVASPEFAGQSTGNFVERSRDLMRNFLSQQRELHSVSVEAEDWDTLIFPTVQMGVFNIDQVGVIQYTAGCRHLTSHLAGLQSDLRNTESRTESV